MAQDENENVSKKRKATDVAPEEDGGADAGNTEGVVSRELSEQEVLEGQVEAVVSIHTSKISLSGNITMVDGLL